MIPIETNRLILRQWRKKDFNLFSELNSDVDSMQYFPNILSQKESDSLAHKIKKNISINGWGLWAIEIKSTGKFAGYVGLNKLKDDLPPSPCIEIGWRLLKCHWGFGYATEAGKRALKYAFNILHLNEVVAFTTLKNKKSIAVMHRLGMIDAHKNFMHPNIDLSSSLCEHVLYKITKNMWENIQEE